jgi:hypothetical protein
MLCTRMVDRWLHGHEWRQRATVFIVPAALVKPVEVLALCTCWSSSMVMSSMYAMSFCVHGPMVYWYVQNVSTFLNTFAIVSPLICVFWIQLTWTNAVFSRIALVSRFCAEIRLLGKIPENIAKILFYQKTHGARRRVEEEQGPGLTTRGRGPALAASTCGEAASAIASTPPSAYIYLMTWKQLGFGIFPR